MRVNGKMKEHKEKEILIIKMEIDMKEILEMDHVKEKELIKKNGEVKIIEN